MDTAVAALLIAGAGAGAGDAGAGDAGATGSGVSAIALISLCGTWVGVSSCALTCAQP